MRTVVIAVYATMAVLWITFLVRLAIVGLIIRHEIGETDARCEKAIATGAVRSRDDVHQEFAMVQGATDRYILLVLDLRKWTHRQFFPHGSAR